MTKINDNRIYYWLSASGAGSKKCNAALSAYSPEEIYQGIVQDRVLQNFFGKHTDILIKSRSTEYLDEMLDKIVRQNIRILTLASDKYPLALRQSEVSPPLILYYRGSLDCLSNPCIAIVGTRRCTNYGKEVSRLFAQEFAQNGVTVVSGLATGVDSFAHDVAKDYGAKTAAVLGGGHNYVAAYSVSLANSIVEKGGLVLSEYPPDFFPTKYTFPERNRIISGLSQAVVVIEAGEKSGALITSDFALEQGREVFAVPNDIFSTKSAGCNNLIRQGLATPAFSAGDILKELRIDFEKETEKTATISLDFFQQKIYTLLQSGKKHYDEIITGGEFGADQLGAILFEMELSGLITRHPSNYYSIKGKGS